MIHLDPDETIFECRDCHRWVGWRVPQNHLPYRDNIKERFLSMEESTALSLVGIEKHYGFCSVCASKTLMSVFSSCTND